MINEILQQAKEFQEMADQYGVNVEAKREDVINKLKGIESENPGLYVILKEAMDSKNPQEINITDLINKAQAAANGD